MKFATLNINASRTVAAIKSLVPPVIYHAAYQAVIVKNIPNKFSYKPHYSPWLEPEFQEMADAVRGNTCLKPESIYTLVHFLKESLWLEGDVMECGVWRGGSAKLLYEGIREAAPEKCLHLFDSFKEWRKRMLLWTAMKQEISAIPRFSTSRILSWVRKGV